MSQLRLSMSPHLVNHMEGLQIDLSLQHWEYTPCYFFFAKDRRSFHTRGVATNKWKGTNEWTAVQNRCMPSKDHGKEKASGESICLWVSEKKKEW
ncbi:hypothetical protein TNCV_3012691 [Trichonephila clavipes]|nr:hypothetical protein TNCV_3012691 [Trichonephila clavipes]